MNLTQDVKKITPHNRYIVIKAGQETITLPDLLVAEIMIVERTSILSLPFYKPAIIGVIHHQAEIVPLLLLRSLLGEPRTLLAESLTLIKLSEVANDLSDQHLAGIGVIVDRVIGSLTISEYQNLQDRRSNLLDFSDKSFNNSAVSNDLTNNLSKKINQTVANIEENEYTPIEIVLSTMLSDIWQPQRWQNSN